MPETGHELIAGATGTGKSRYVELKIKASFEKDKPCAFIDPKGDSYWHILWWLTSTPDGQEAYQRNKHRILFFNPVTKADHILCFNALSPVAQLPYANIDTTAMVANSLVSHIRKQAGYDIGDATRMQNIMNAAIATLLEGGHGEYTLSEMPFLFSAFIKQISGKRVISTFNPFVEKLLPNLTHYATKLFWSHQWATWTQDARREWTQSTLGQVFHYLFDFNVQMSICSSKHARMDFDRVINDGYWVFAHLPEGILKDSTIVLGNIIISRLFNSAMQRISNNGNHYRVILDEAAHFNSGPLAEILAMARSHRLWLSLVVQSLGQMERTVNGDLQQKIEREVRQNVHYITTFRNVEDSVYFSQLMFPVTGRKEIPHDEYKRLLPVPGEINMSQRRFHVLQDRQFIYYDKTKAVTPKACFVPPFYLSEIDWPRLLWFEQEHLRATGTPRVEIEREITGRYERIAALFQSDPPTRRATPSNLVFGGEL